MNPRDEFIDLMTENAKTNGLDDFSAKLMAILFLEPTDISLEDVALKTGYCLSSISTGVKLLERMGFVRKIKKPPSKKVYLKMENDMCELLSAMLKKRHESVISRSKSRLPDIIKNYKSSKSSKDELKIIEHYYEDIMLSGALINDLISKMEKMRRKQ
jgi:DNA-binding transcriptional regulator GbsR (MarR family)